MVLKILFDLVLKGLTPAKVFCDNESAIKLALNPVIHEKTKHFEFDLHFVREKVTNRVLKIEKISSSKRRADILTKFLNPMQHNFLVNELGLVNPFSNG